MIYQPLAFNFEDIDNLLCSLLTTKQLTTIKLLNKSTLALLASEKFWISRLQQKYVRLAIPNKIKDQTNKLIELYQILEQKDDIKLLKYAEHYEYVDIIEFMAKERKYIFTTGANLLAKYGKLTTLKQLPYTCPDGLGLLAAAENNQIEVTNWLMKEKKVEPAIVEMISSGRFEVAKFFNQNWLTRIAHHKDSIARYGRLDIFKLLAENNIFPNIGEINTVAENGHFAILQYFDCNQILPDSNGCNLALINNHQEIVDWLLSKNIKPNRFAYPGLIIKYRLEGIKLLLADNIFPTNDHVRQAIVFNKIAIVKVFFQYGFIPNSIDVDKKIQDGNVVILELFAQYNLITVKHANYAAESGKFEILELFAQYQILPDVKGANRVCIGFNYSIKILNWLEKHEVLPNQEGANLAIKFDDEIILKWLSIRNIFPF